MSFDSARDVAVLFGGGDAGSFYNGETWEWGGVSWALRSTTGPSPRNGHAMAYDSARGKTVLFGGLNNADFENDTWEWDGDGWALRTDTGPPLRAEHAMTFDNVRNVTILHGGTHGARLDDTWAWDGQAWSLLSVGGPTPRAEHDIVFDSMRGTTLLFGGYAVDESGSGDMGDTWEMATISILQSPASQSVVAGDPVSFTVEIDNLPQTFQWRRDGNPLVDDGRISGTQTDTLTISSTDLSDSGVFDVLIGTTCISNSATLEVLSPCPENCGDIHNDGVVNLVDFAAFAKCFGLPPASSVDCSCSDLNRDGLVNLVDFATFSILFGGPAMGFPPNCL